MSSARLKVSKVPTNIITGFLGVGKTSAILHLLKNKPSDERWAVLVNEFGEIGVDGSFLQGQSTEESGVFVREVPGGCMCCAAGVPMRVALTQLLVKAKPDRLLIEPTGLGHPKEVLHVLSDRNFQDVLSIQNTIVLVDARQLADARYTDNDVFNQQIEIADVVVGNKRDLYQQADYAALEKYVQQKGLAQVSILTTQQGVIDVAYLDGAAQSIGIDADVHDHHHSHSHHDASLDEMPIPDVGYVQAINHGEGFESVGWRFAEDKVFNRAQLIDVLAALHVERVKGVFITDEGPWACNIAADTMSAFALDECRESRIEIIAAKISDNWSARLMACLL